MVSKRFLLFLGATLMAGLALTATAASATGQRLMAACAKAFKNFSPVQARSVAAISSAFQQYGDGDGRKLIYMIALAYHESQLKPIKEIKAPEGSFVWDEYQSRYWPSGYYGRGFVQLTWDYNYKKMSKELGVDLVNNPDLALNTEVAAKIMVIGMMRGLFTGKKLSDYINGNSQDYYNARKTVGAIMVAGTDTAARIVGLLKKISSHL